MNMQIENQNIQTATNKPIRTCLPTKKFIKLEAWRKCKEIKSIVYAEIIPALPADQQGNLGSLLKNAATSITTNYIPYNRKISENLEKINYQQDAQFIKAARHALSRLKNYITICSDFNYIDTGVYNKGILLIENTKALLNRYIYFLSR
ncbi:MAG: four helix bundle protein [Chlorobi bacterium]|nr:four helix bundle protein [Chlorobiota bacterium]